MAGHSKWKNIQHRKGRQDAIKAKIFTKISKEIYAAVRNGGPDTNTNFKLKLAIAKAKQNNMPNDNIERTIKKAMGETGGSNFEEITYEGYGPGGVAVMVQALTDNRNRTAADVRHVFNKNDGNLGESGSVTWMFSRKGILTIDKEKIDLDEDTLMLMVLEAGALDLQVEDDSYEIIVDPEQFESVKDSLEQDGIEFSSAEITMVPQNTVTLTGENALKMIKLIEALEDLDDVQSVQSNADIDESVLDF
ncbi:transcriptional regulator [Vulcanibacillus modesticaldus]|uniref:Probable transcriptional regulatory protein BHF71_05720 n=1 Tax=Vulcanibacillus modesticaldus TaxID=337097 RepID=A0A1D2YWP6_9BACI|nr:YebC/PmpR family DNA-binding transcriptional regulator [Vulcanibacillus modesticaldus]OEG00185.1 transcriptional regulator [Vulcanibacillus modesticaldus]